MWLPASVAICDDALLYMLSMIPNLESLEPLLFIFRVKSNVALVDHLQVRKQDAIILVRALGRHGRR